MRPDKKGESSEQKQMLATHTLYTSDLESLRSSATRMADVRVLRVDVLWHRSGCVVYYVIAQAAGQAGHLDARWGHAMLDELDIAPDDRASSSCRVLRSVRLDGATLDECVEILSSEAKSV